jgi:hypothetical protein
LTKTVRDNEKYIVKCQFNWESKEFDAELSSIFADNGHPAIVSRPV